MQNIFTFGVKTRLWFIILYGGVGEWFIPVVLKTTAPKGAVGSNPASSAFITNSKKVCYI